MQVINYQDQLRFQDCEVTLGKFDGLHLGHRKLIEELLSKSESERQRVAFTFSMHPCRLFSNREIRLIYTEQEKKSLFAQTGIDALVTFPFNDETAQMEPEHFILKIMLEHLHAKRIIVGADFCFGRQRRGNVKLLEEYGKRYGYELCVVDKVLYDREPISSSRIRKELSDGSIQKVNEMLGQPYFLESEVVHGRQLGRKIQMPTANQLVSKEKLLPNKGVYASYVWVGQKRYEAVTNLGVKPTVGGEPVMGAESFLFDFQGDLYGKIIRTELIEFIRQEQKFDSIDALSRQMKADASQARQILKPSTKSRG